MYSLEEREKAVKLYIQYGLKAAKVIRELGYPNRHVIVRWYQEYQANQKLHEKRRSTSKYTAEQRKAAVQYYLEHGESYINTVRKLGYPSRQQLAQWLDDDAPEVRRDCVHIGSHPHQPEKIKEEAVVAFCSRKCSAKEIAQRYGVSRGTLYQWKKELLPDQGEHLMKANIKESKDNQAENASLISTGALCSKEIATEAAQSGNKPDTCSDAISSKGMTPENATEDKASPCPDAPGNKGSTSGDAENASHACHEASSGKEMAPQKAQSGSEPETLPDVSSNNAATEVQTSGKSNECLDPLSGQAMTVEEAKSEIELLTKKVDDLRNQAEDFQKQVHKLRLEKAILEKTAEIIKKDGGINPEDLSNREKAIVIDAEKKDYSLHELLVAMKISKSSYFYQESAFKKPDKYTAVRKTLASIFNDNYQCYGYRRLYSEVRKQGLCLSEKVIRRLMKEEGLQVKCKRRRKYSSYKGEISPEVPNLIKRNFHADKPNEKWLTDITEFAIPAGKVYLSPIIDCFDGEPVSWTIGTSPSADLAKRMLDDAIKTLPEGEHPIVHSDRGFHYRCPRWIQRMNEAGLTRSMSKKGCSPDNSACEGFFGRIKEEMFYYRSWQGVSINEFIKYVDKYLHWYVEKRNKTVLGGLSPLEYRKKLGFI